jgi:hypothetical protein
LSQALGMAFFTVTTEPVGRVTSHIAKFEVLTTLFVKIEVLWVVKTCRLVNGHRCFWGIVVPIGLFDREFGGAVG